MSSGGDGENEFAKTICTICYEDLKPLVEDLQAISICGHVFHELCLQQWLEYCNTKKSTCPVCKQKCCQDNVNRLYFQSIGDPNELIASQKSSKRSGDEDENPILLRREITKLEGKLSGLGSSFERQQNELKLLNEELHICKEEAKKEAVSKNEALQQISVIRNVLKARSEDLVRTENECSKLQQRNLALAKELAALKLVSDTNLDEEEVLKLASFGHCNNNKDTIDILKKSLVLRNKSYKELMAQCNLLGRGETRSVKKLEKAKEKMKKLKARVQELEMALEVKDNEVLRALKASKKRSHEEVDINDVKGIPCSPRINKLMSEDPVEQPAEPFRTSTQFNGLSNHPSRFRKTTTSNFDKDLGVIDVDTGRNLNSVNTQNMKELYPPMSLHSSPSLKPRTISSTREDLNLRKFSFLQSMSAFNTKTEDSVREKISSVGFTGSSSGAPTGISNTSADAMEEDVIEIHQPSSDEDVVILDKSTEDPPVRDIRKEASSLVPPSTSGDQCFAGGFIGPDGTNRYLGKWCKRTQTKTSVSTSPAMQGLNSSDGDLIAVGADGRGGTVKVLKSQNLSDTKVSSVISKRSVGKQSGQQSQGSLQIEHFFAKANRSK